MNGFYAPSYKNKYLVRPHDNQIFELDPSNNCYRACVDARYPDGTKLNAQSHFTFENLTENHDFFPIEESEIEFHEQKHQEHLEFTSWQHRPDGHGGCKGGTYEEFLKRKKIT